MYGVYRISSIKEFRNSSWYQSQFSETLIPSGRLLFRPSFNPAISLSSHLSFRPSLSGHLSIRPSLSLAISPCSQAGISGFLLFPISNNHIRLSLRPVSLVSSSSLFPATIFGCLPHLHDKIRNGIITSIQRHSTRIISVI